MPSFDDSVQFIAWGSYDQGKPRVRMLLEALRKRRGLASEINLNVWRGIDDKSVAGWTRILGALARLVAGYPFALLRLAMKPRDQMVILLYPAIIDIFIVWLIARLRGHKIVFDAFISFHDTVVSDRRLLSPDGIWARSLWYVERLALRLADIVVVDTDQHGSHFSTTFQIPTTKFITVPVGAESLFWEARNRAVSEKMPNGIPTRYALFYGQFIPLHGIETILEAVALTEKNSIHWLIIGSGQEEGVARKFIERHSPENMTWLPWVDYILLPDLIRHATVSLGIFGNTDKAARVVPNKMFQILAAGGSIITRECPPVTVLAQKFPHTIRLVPPGDARALACAVIEAFANDDAMPIPTSMREALSPSEGVEELIRILSISRKTEKCVQ